MSKRIVTLLFVLVALPVLGMAFSAPLVSQAQDTPTATPSPTPLPCFAYQGEVITTRLSYYMGEGTGYLQSGQLTDALLSFGCVIQLQPSFVPGHTSRAIAYTALRDFDRALADYDAALALDPNLVPAYNNRGIVHAAMREYEKALADFGDAVRLEPEFVSGYINRGVIKAVLNDFTGAIADLNRALELSGLPGVVADLRDPDRPTDAPVPDYDPEHAQAYAVLGIIYSAYALDNYNTYLFLTGSRGDARIQSAAGSLESRFTFDLRLDDGTWLLVAAFEEQAP